jgi:membrane-associated phospholipid phosphatase
MTRARFTPRNAERQGETGLESVTTPPRRRQPFARHPLVRAVGTLAVVGLVLLVVGVVLGLVLIGRHGGGALQHLDNRMEHWSTHHRGPFVGLDKVIATWGDAGLLGPVCVVVGIVMFAIRRTPRSLAPILAYLGGEGLVFLIRMVIHRHRPPTASYPAPGAIRGVHETSYSFPSGHAVAVTAVFFALFGLLAVSGHGRWPWAAAFILSAFVADSRLVLGVHWFSDVAIGLVLGIAWGVTVALTCRDLRWTDLHFRTPDRPPVPPDRPR